MERDPARLPSVSHLLSHPELEGIPHEAAVAGARAAIAEARTAPKWDLQAIARRAGEMARARSATGYPEAINCTGVLLHTGLGRAPLAALAREAALRASGTVCLEIDPETGARGDRVGPLRELLTEITGAEDALVVNNNAAAVFLAVHTLASGAEALLSRGQSVEIGGSFRLPDVIRSAGARLVDVGTTNRTRISDYADQLGPNTRIVLRCHPSNFAISGFVEEPTIAELGAFAASNNIALIDDMGSGCLVHTEDFGLPHEPTIQESISAGAHLVTASGDKLIGGPQCGILVGRRDVIERCRKSPLARALRIDKMTAASLEVTLQLIRDKRFEEIPTLRYLARAESETRSVAEAVATKCNSDCEPSSAEPGGGSLPGVKLPSWRVGIPGPADELARKLRASEPGVFGYVQDGKLWLDMLTVDSSQVDALARVILGAASA